MGAGKGTQFAVAVVMTAMSLATSAAGAVAQPGPTAPSAVAAARRVALPDATPRLPAGAVAKQGGATTGTTTITVTLRRRDEAGFQRYLSERRAAGARRSGALTVRQLTDHFNASAADELRVEQWLRGAGLRTTGSANRLTVTATGSRPQVEQAFAVSIDDYTAAGRAFASNTTAPSVPAELAPIVQAVSGLSTLGRPVSLHHATRSLRAPSPPAPPGSAFIKKYPWRNKAAADQYCRDYSWNNYPGGSVAGSDWATWIIFVVLCLLFENWAGQKQGDCMDQLVNHDAVDFAKKLAYCRNVLANDPPEKIGFLEYDTFKRSDVADWLALTHLDPAQLSQLTKVDVNGGVASPGPASDEVLLDIDAALAVDQYSNRNKLVVYDAPPSTSFETMFNTMINDGVTVISNSWSQCEDQTSLAEARAIDSVLAQAEADGIAVFNGTGDTGSTCLDGHANTVGVPADSPHAIAVGGTALDLGLGLTYGKERYWDDSSAVPAGGSAGFGVSAYFPRPSFQNGLTSATGRSVPDLTTPAAPGGGLMICQADHGGCPNGLLYGGTSMAAPEMAVLATDLNQAVGANFVDPIATFYGAAASKPSSFHSAASMGSDFAHVGLGSPSFDLLLAALRGQSAGAPVVANSHAFGIRAVPADGVTVGEVRVGLADANSFPVAGRHVTLTPLGGSAHVVAPNGITDVTGGAVAFSVTDTVPETVSFSVVDTTDGLTLPVHPTLTFLPPVAAGSSVVASPAIVVNDGVAKVTVSVYLQDAQGQPAAGKTVSLVASGGSSVIRPAGSPNPGSTAVTDSAGTATFTATDTAQESVAFNAVDVSDGNLVVPGSATATFQAAGAPTCVDTTPVGVGGTSVTPFATGFPQNQQALVTNVGGLTFTQPPCIGAEQPAFDATGRAFVPDPTSGQIFVFGSGGGTAGSGTALAGGSYLPGGQLGGLTFGKDGALYAGLTNTNGNFNQPQFVQLDPTTGAVKRVLATTANGMTPCPGYSATDPLSGDLFVSDDCGGALTNSTITRIANPTSANPTLSAYANVGGLPTQLAFAPDGTLFTTNLNANAVVRITGTNAGTPVVSTVTTFANTPFALAVSAVDGQGHPTALLVTDIFGNILRVDLGNVPPTVTTVANGTGKGQLLPAVVLGHDGCAYVADGDRLVKVSTPCTGPVTATPQLTLSGPATTHVPIGTTLTVTAKLRNVAKPAGTPIVFSVLGANPQVRLVRADGTGTATFTETGVRRGTDTIVASTPLASSDLVSNHIAYSWVAGKDTTFIALDRSPGIGRVGHPTVITASLVDVTHSPTTPVGSATVHVDVGGLPCTITTAAGTGTGSCTITPNANGIRPVTATYAGDAGRLPSTATNALDVGGPSTAAPPTVSGAPAQLVRPGSGTAPLTFTVSLDHAASTPMTVHFHTEDGTALATVDYTPTSGTATVPAGQLSTTVPVTILGNQSDEPDKTFSLVLTSPTTAVIGTAKAAGTIKANHLLAGCPANPSANQRYICHLYFDALGRAAEPGGLAYWVHLLDTGTSRLQMATSYLATPEARHVLVNRLYVLFLRRQGDASGVSYWADRLLHGATPDDIRVFLAESPEFFTKAGATNTGFVTLLFSDVFHRQVDPGGLIYWRQRLDAGASRASVIQSFLGTSEARTHIVDDIDVRFLRRHPTGAETTALLADLAAHGEIFVYDETAASAEYFNRP
ncbi:MAG: hypothetical protein JWN46_627 [Acidimicrobiales bacterium]|nr:hypothetical protein [Acidimicrobiales bacterium]